MAARHPHSEFVHIIEAIDAEASAVARGLIQRLRLSRLLHRFPGRPVWAVFVLINGFVTIAILAAVAMASGTPFIFPSLGPTAFVFFFEPTEPSASPRNALFGHAIGIACGYAALWLLGLVHAGSAMTEGVNGRRVMRPPCPSL
jgi:CBS domain-containing membrane protein